VSKIHNNYVHSLSTLLPYAEKRIETLQEEIKFTEAMADLVQTHSNTIAILAKGFLEARKYISAKEVTEFLDEHLRARIGTRLIAEQHIALHFSSKPHARLSDKDEDPNRYRESTFIGVIDTALKPAALVRTCESMVGEICELKYGVRPTIKIIGSEDTTIAHVPMHLEYVLTELLKNSFRATIEAGMEKEPIEVTIAPAPANGPKTTPEPDEENQSESKHAPAAISNYHQGTVDLASGSNKAAQSASANIRPLDTSTPGVTIRIRDRGGGISPEVHSKLWEYGFTTFNEDEINEKTSGGQGITALDVISGGAGGGSSLAGLGYGLPLGRAYAEYFGGGIAVQSLWGWGTDVYLSLRGVGRIQ
jgi:signal transduction histidine kinase